MPVDLGSFDAIIGMDWLAKYQAVIVCAEKIVRIPWGNETLIIHGDGSNRGNATRLSIISCTKTEKYVKKGFPIFLAHITTKEMEDKSEKKRLKDTVGHEAAYGMTWKTLMKMMTEKYCPQNDIRKLEMKLWDLKVNGTDLASYTQRYQELALLCGRMFSEESDKIEKYVGGLPDMIHGSVVASKPKTMQEAIEIATELMDKKICTFAECETARKRKFENTSRNIQNQQQQHSNKRQNTDRVYTATSGEKKQYVGSRPLCAKCNYHHNGPCAPKCRNCNKIGHLARD
nr:reverse transcriptase domain-containing protein [Tanacetum cinerariifolium]